MGAPRYDDPRTPNTGVPTAGGTYADMGAYEFVETAESNVDLIVSAVTGPSTAVAGDRVKMYWTVRNVGSGEVVGPWTDRIGLIYSPDNFPMSVAVARVLSGQGVRLGPGESYETSAEVVVPASVVGDHLWQITTNSGGEVFEGRNAENNTGQSLSPVFLDLPDLVIGGAPLTRGFDSPGSTVYYKVVATAGQDFAVNLDLADDTGSTTLYVGYEYLPTPYQYDVKSLQWIAADSRLAMSNRQSGLYYVAAQLGGASAYPAGYSISAEESGFELYSVTPAQGGRNGPVTITVYGQSLPANAGVRLVTANGTLEPAAFVAQDGGRELRGTFDLSSADTGLADVVVFGPGSTAHVLEDSFEILSGGASQFWFDLAGPQAVRAGRETNFTLRWGNRGTIDAPLQLIDVAIPADVEIALVQGGSPLTDRLMLLTAVPNSAVAGIPPGYEDSRDLYVTLKANHGFQFDYGVVAADSPVLAASTLTGLRWRRWLARKG